MEEIKLTDGTMLVPLEATEKEALELEIKAVLDKYDAMYLPAIKEVKTLTQISQTASLFLLKKKAPTKEEVESPYIENGEENKETSPEA